MPGGMPDPDMVFVGGLHRSGTTLLARILEDHPDVTGLQDTGVPMDEGQHLQEVYPAARELGGAGHFGLRDGGHLTEDDAEEGMRQRLEAAWEPYWGSDAPVRIEKSPPNLVRTRFLRALFPEARFVVLLRHPAAACLATHKWSTVNTLHHLLKHWFRCHDLFDGDRHHLERVHVVKYEDLVAAPDEEIADVHAFLDLDPAPVRREVRRDVNARYFGRWRARREGWLDGLYIGWLASRFEEQARRFGYSLEDLARCEPWPTEGPGAQR